MKIGFSPIIRISGKESTQQQKRIETLKAAMQTLKAALQRQLTITIKKKQHQKKQQQKQQRQQQTRSLDLSRMRRHFQKSQADSQSLVTRLRLLKRPLN